MEKVGAGKFGTQFLIVCIGRDKNIVVCKKTFKALEMGSILKSEFTYNYDCLGHFCFQLNLLNALLYIKKSF